MASEAYVTATNEKLGTRGFGRELMGRDRCFELRESPVPYRGILGHGNECLRLENNHFWDDNSRISMI